MHHYIIVYLLYEFESLAHAHAALLTNQNQGLFQYSIGSAHPLNQGDSPNSPDPFSPTEGGSGHETRLAYKGRLMG